MDRRYLTGAAALLAMAGSAGCGEPSAGNGGAGGASSTASLATTGSKSSTNVASTSGSKASSSSGTPFVCDPPAAPGSLYEKDALLQFEFEPTSMCQYRGDVLLIVNTAAV